MKMVLSLLLAAGTCCAQADVLLYKAKITSVRNGEGTTSTMSIGGYLVWNPDAAEFMFVESFPKIKMFTTLQLAWDVSIVRAGNSKTNVVLHEARTYDDGTMSAVMVSGSESLVNIGTSTAPMYWLVPKSFKHFSRVVYPADDGYSHSEELSGSMTYDSKLTPLANTSGDDVWAAVDRVKTLLLLQGYVDADALSAAKSKAPNSTSGIIRGK